MFNIKDLDIMQSTLLTTYPLFASFIQDRKEILGELQFAFVCFLVGQGIDKFCRWDSTSVGSIVENMSLFLEAFYLFFSLAWSITFVNCKESGNIFPTWTKQPSPMKCLLNIVNI